MNSTAHPSSLPEETRDCDPVTADQEGENLTIQPFRFPFSPKAFAPAKHNDKPWHQQGNKSNHDQRPGAAPKGSRRSMGKR